MQNPKTKTSLPLILAAGALWGFVEFGAGLGLQKCAALYTGSILTGLSFFWISFIWSRDKHFLSLLLILLLAIGFKWMDALLLHLPWNHASIVNPIFALFTAVLGFSVLMLLFGKRFFKNTRNRILLGGGSAMLATGLFPLVKFATGIPACTWAATQIPQSVATAPVAVLIAMITVPLGYVASTWLQKRMDGAATDGNPLYFGRWSTAVFFLCVMILVLARVA